MATAKRRHDGPDGGPADDLGDEEDSDEEIGVGSEADLLEKRVKVEHDIFGGGVSGNGGMPPFNGLPPQLHHIM